MNEIGIDSFPAMFPRSVREAMLDDLRREDAAGLVYVGHDENGQPAIHLLSFSLDISPAMYALRWILRQVVDDALASLDERRATR